LQERTIDHEIDARGPDKSGAIGRGPMFAATQTTSN